ncbi:Predicted oxidoreductase [Actinacidiphila yanglinensis]|uniref:Predicted oxidoreductase n=1 Tax=Actinacidiphila yanglinensis TaxID=310779 RepID=A0A1H6EDN3_9ACTN|nr:oxidoreductase [Actinacidiphila yanglinensis]SEG94984.1 Predicted oxidoreductase [Actinacidiphila yanglinensis]
MAATTPLRTITLADDLTITRMGYGAMQLAGPNVFGQPKDRDQAVAAVEAGITHIDTSDFYGPAVVNELIKEALHPYPEGLHIVTKVGGRRDDTGGWVPAHDPKDLKAQVRENLQHLGLETLDVVNLRTWALDVPNDDSIAEPFSALNELRERGLIRHLGLSGVSDAQLTEAQAIAPVVTVQNLYNLAKREDDRLVDRCAAENIAYAGFFPLGGYSPLQSQELTDIADRLGATPQQVALAWLLQRSPTMVVIPGTSSVGHLRENIAAADLALPADAVAALDAITR